MKQEVRLSRVIQIILIICAAVAILLIWPVRAWPEKITSAVQNEVYSVSGEVTAEANVMQEFIPEYSNTESIRVMVDSYGAQTGKFMFHFYDKDLTLLWEADRSFAETEAVSYFTFPIKMELHEGEPYYYTLDYIDTPFAICYDEQQFSGQSGNGSLYYALEEIPGCMAITQYNYTADMGWKKVLALDAFILLGMAVLCTFVFFFLKFTRLDRLVNTDQAVHVSAGSVMIAAMLYAAWFVAVKKTFNSSWIDITVYLAGILLLGLALLYAVMQIRTGCIKINRKTPGIKLPVYVQTLFWTMAILACCQFVNAGSNYAQGLALRELCIYIALAMISMFAGKELWNIWNALYTVIAVTAGYFYCKPFVGAGEPYETAVRTAVMFGIWGIIIISVIYNCMHKRIAKLSLMYAALTGIFFALLLVFRNSNVWEIAVVVPFGLLYIRRIDQAKMNLLLQNIANAVILSFFVLSIQALQHRPFHYYMRIRYSGMFMTVTVTAVYLVLVFAVVLCKLFTSYDKSHKLKSIWKELIVLGLVCSYQFLTLSRTGIMTCAAVYIAGLVIYMLFHYKKHTEIWKYIAYSALAIVWFIPVVFTLSRTIPALADDPIIYEGELFLDSIRKGESVDSTRYITVKRFLGLSTERILGKADLDHVTQSGKTVEEALKEAAGQEGNASDILKESGVTVNEDSISYIDDYGSEYIIETPGYSNGRLDIYRKYLSSLNMRGHSAVGLPEENGNIIVHAHNSFIQMAYDCGIITGIVFILFYIIFGFRTIRYYKLRMRTDSYAMLPLLIFAAFGISSMVEYVFRPTIPLGFVFLLMITPLLTKFESFSDQNEEGTDIGLEQGNK